jgi:hypothetical protein
LNLRHGAVVEGHPAALVAQRLAHELDVGGELARVEGHLGVEEVAHQRHAHASLHGRPHDDALEVFGDEEKDESPASDFSDADSFFNLPAGSHDDEDEDDDHRR